MTDTPTEARDIVERLRDTKAEVACIDWLDSDAPMPRESQIIDFINQLRRDLLAARGAALEEAAKMHDQLAGEYINLAEELARAYREGWMGRGRMTGSVSVKVFGTASEDYAAKRLTELASQSQEEKRS